MAGKPQKNSVRTMAKLTGLSPMTVSRIMRGLPNVKEENRRRIMQLVDCLGYDFNNHGKARRANRELNVALNLSWTKRNELGAYDFYAQLHYNCKSLLNNAGFSVFTIDFDGDREAAVREMENCGTLVMMGPMSESAEALALSYTKARLVSLVSVRPGMVSICPDDVGGGELAGGALMGLGHRHVAVFATPDEQCFRRRAAGLSAVMGISLAGGQIDYISYHESSDGDESERTKQKALSDYFGACDGKYPSAIFAPGYYAAISAYRYLKRHGWKIPEDIGLIGYDNISYYQILDISISRVDFDIKDIARQLVALLQTPRKCFDGNLTIHTSCRYTDCGSVIPKADMHALKVRQA